MFHSLSSSADIAGTTNKKEKDLKQSRCYSLRSLIEVCKNKKNKTSKGKGHIKTGVRCRNIERWEWCTKFSTCLYTSPIYVYLR